MESAPVSQITELAAFTHVIGLGRNCDTIHQIRRRFPSELKFPFDWAHTERQSLAKIIMADLANLFRKQNTLIEFPGDIKTARITDLPSGLIDIHSCGRDNPERHLDRVAARYDFMARVWNEVLSDLDSNILFVRVDHDLNWDRTGVPSGYRSWSSAIEALISEKFPQLRFMVLWLYYSNTEDIGWTSPRGLNEQVDRSAHWQGDDAAWDRMWERVERHLRARAEMSPAHPATTASSQW